MLRQLLNLVLVELNNKHERGLTIDDKILQIIEEINDLEIKHAQAIADAERWGDITDNSHWRTVEVNRIKRVIEAKKGMIEILRRV